MKKKSFKEKKCKECGEKFTPQRSFQATCSMDCAIKDSKKKTKKAKEKKDREEIKQMKENLMTLTDWKKKLEPEINKIVRLIDKGQPCIATGSLKGKSNAGHYISVGSNDTIRFHLHNIHIQSEHSNCWKGGDTIRYQDGIVKIYGQEYLDYMNSLKNIQPIKLSIPEIKEIIPVAREIVRELTKLNMVYPPKVRMELRTKYNKRLGIYKQKP